MHLHLVRLAARPVPLRPAKVVVLEALETLSPEHRDVLVELYYRGRSVVEAAAALGVPPGTVKSRSYYALRALRVTMGGQAAGVAR